jgi:histidyl-tRNA synthetase
VLVIPMTEDLSYAISAAAQLRRSGIRTQLYSENKKFKAKMSYADKIGVPYIVLIGEDEINEGVISLKDMTTGEQRKLSVEAASIDIISELEERAAAPVILA